MLHNHDLNHETRDADRKDARLAQGKVTLAPVFCKPKLTAYLGRIAQRLSTCAQKQFAPNMCNTPSFLLVLLRDWLTKVVNQSEIRSTGIHRTTTKLFSTRIFAYGHSRYGVFYNGLTSSL